MMAENQLGGGQETDKGDGETFVVMVERRNEEEGGDKSEEGGVLLLIDVRTQLWPGQSRVTWKLFRPWTNTTQWYCQGPATTH